jgi:16S rRNA (cytidine1402-2'-O)-methyltransferase
MNKLYLVPTPIGNLEDMTFRAIRILKEVDFVLAEDTRKTGLLMKHFDIQNKMKSFHQHNEHQQTTIVIDMLKSGIKMALVTDAGTPAISDPGFLLVRECLKNNIEVECLPGATAFVPALVNSGLPADRFFFEGFLPHKKGRKSRLQYISEKTYTIILYESPHRLLKTLDNLIEFMGEDRKACVSRELTKMYEENKRGSLFELKSYFESKTVKGEIVIIINGKREENK